MDITIASLFWIAASLTLISSLLAWSGPAFWVGEIVAPLSPQMIVSAIGGLCLSMACGQTPPAILFATSVVSLLILITLKLSQLRRLPPYFAHANDGKRSISIVMANVLCTNTRYEKLIACAKIQNPTVLVAIEMTDAWIDNSSELLTQYKYAFTPKGLGLFGMAAYAHEPFEHRLVRVGEREAPLLCLFFQDFSVFITHPWPPLGAAMARESQLYFKTLEQLAQAEKKPLVLIGDFNSTIWSAYMRPFLKPSWLWPHGAGITYTWPTAFPPLAMQLDHTVTHGFHAGLLQVLPAIGSDHFPIRVDLNL